MIRGKRGQEGGSNWLLVALIVGAVVLVLVLTGAGGKIINLFKTSTAATSTSTIDIIRTKCQNACTTVQMFTYCCEENKIQFPDKSIVTLIGCTDPRLAPTDCSLNCAGYSCAVPLPDVCDKQKIANGNSGMLKPACNGTEIPIKGYRESILKAGYVGDVRYLCTDQLGEWKDTCVPSTETELTGVADKEGTEKCCVLTEKFAKQCCAPTA